MLCRISVLIALFILSGCGGAGSDPSSPSAPSAQNPELKVINGTQEDNANYPEFVKLAVIHADGSTAFCSGTVIGRDTVLSAAHCLLGDVRYVYINSVLGWTKVTGYIWHPALGIDQNGLLFYDLSLLFAPGLNLPKLGVLTSAPVAPGQLATVFGFGRTELAPFGQLNHGQMTIEAASVQHLLASYSDKSGVCYGDSGGAVTAEYLDQQSSFYKRALIGVISSATATNCAPGTKAAFINLQDPAVLEFLYSNVYDLDTY